MKIVASILLITFSFVAHAEGLEGIGVELGVGSGTAAIKNPDASTAKYKLLGIRGRVLFPMINEKDFGANFVGAFRYMDMDNGANNAFQSESIKMRGPGAGLELRLFKFVIGAEYDLMKTRHYAIGNLSHEMEYEMPVLNLYGGLNLQLRHITVSFSYNMGSGNVPKSETGLRKDSPYSDQVYWLQFIYSTGASTQGLLGFFF